MGILPPNIIYFDVDIVITERSTYLNLYEMFQPLKVFFFAFVNCNYEAKLIHLYLLHILAL